MVSVQTTSYLSAAEWQWYWYFDNIESNNNFYLGANIMAMENTQR